MPTSAGDVLKHHLRPYCDWCDVGSRTLQVRTAARQGTFTFRLVSLADMRVAFPGLVYRMGPIMVSRSRVTGVPCRNLGSMTVKIAHQLYIGTWKVVTLPADMSLLDGE